MDHINVIDDYAAIRQRMADLRTNKEVNVEKVAAPRVLQIGDRVTYVSDRSLIGRVVRINACGDCCDVIWEPSPQYPEGTGSLYYHSISLELI